MKTLAIATSVLVGVLGLSVPQNKTGVTKTKAVPAASVAKLPPGKTYEIDLTRSGTIYKFDAGNTDFSRVTIRTATGVRNYADLLKMSGMSFRGSLLVGTPADMGNYLSHLPHPKGGTGTPNYDCGAIACKCNGIVDCLKLIFSGSCFDPLSCNPETGNCFCQAKA